MAVNVNDLNKQSAQLMMEDIQKQLDAQKQQLQQAMSKNDDIDYKKQLEEANLQIQSLTDAISQKDKMLNDYQALNQKLFLRIGQPMNIGAINPTNGEPEITEDERLCKSAMDKINAYNSQIENQNKGEQ